jgi:uncharacterized protein (TIGR03067 family)
MTIEASETSEVEMSKRLSLLIAVVLLAGAEPSDAAKDDLKKMQGEWAAEKAQRGGTDAPADVLGKLRVKIDGDRISIDEGEAREEKAQIALDPAQKPAAMDIKLLRQGGEMVKGIYKIDGDTLTICWAKDGDRPTEFASKAGTSHVLFVLKRRK